MVLVRFVVGIGIGIGFSRGQLVVQVQFVGAHRHVQRARPLGQLRNNRWTLMARLSRAFQRQPHRIGVRHITAERIGYRRLHGLCAIARQQLRHCSCDRAQVVIALGGAFEQLRNPRHGLGQLVRGAVLPCASLVIYQGINVSRHLNLLRTVKAAQVLGQHRLSIEHAYTLGRASTVRVRRTWVWGME